MLHTFFTSLESILPIMIMIAVGYGMARMKWIDNHFGSAITKFILNIALPCYMIFNLTDSFDRDRFLSLAHGIIVPCLSMGICYLLAVLASKLLHVPRSRCGIFRSIFFCSNTVFIGLPVNLELFGAKSVPYVLLYYIVNTSYFWTLGNYEISRDGEGAAHASFFSRETLRRILSPALLGFLVGLVLILLRVKLPAFVRDSLEYLGNPTTPLALIFIGLVLSTIRLSHFRLNRELVVLLLARFVLAPSLTLLLVHLIPVPALMGKVFVIQSAMPAMTNTSIVAKGCGADYQFASIATVVTTLGCAVAIPALMMLL